MVEVGVGGQCRGADRDGELVIGGGGRCLGGVDVQPERERGGAARGDADRLGHGVGVGGAVPIQPCVPGTVVRRLARTVADDAGGRGPWRGRSVLEAGVAELLPGSAGAAAAAELDVGDGVQFDALGSACQVCYRERLAGNQE